MLKVHRRYSNIDCISQTAPTFQKRPFPIIVATGHYKHHVGSLMWERLEPASSSACLSSSIDITFRRASIM
jgi:hypothetical protein